MLLTFGSKIVYPSLGPCLVLAIVKRVIDGVPLQFYQLRILSGGGEIFVPVDGFRLVGVRPLLEKSDIPRLLEGLKEPAKAGMDFRQRQLHILFSFESGSPWDLVEIVASLTELAETKPPSFKERNWLNRAKCQLVCEIAEVLGANIVEVESQVDQALQERPRTIPLRPLKRDHRVLAVPSAQESSSYRRH